MATELGSAFISVGLGTNKLGPEIKKMFSDSGGDAESAGKSAGSRFGGAVGLAAAAVGALGIGTFFKSAIGGAADLEQSVGAVDAVFKGSAGQMHEWSKSAATDVGLTQNEFNTLGTLIGSQLKNGGTAMDELAPKTKDLIGVGADLASMFGGTTQDAVAALSSALKGERDPIEAYGVSLSQAKIDAEAAALGFSKVGGSLSAEANQAATLSLIMKQTADAHGNFASEADTLSHKQQVLNAQWNDGKAAIGSALLPAVSSVTGALSSALGPAMTGALSVTKELVGGFTAMGAAFKAGDGDITSSGFAGVMERIGLTARSAFDGIAPVVSSLAASFGPLIPQVFSLMSAFSPLGLIFKVIQPILPQLVGLFTQLGSTIGGLLSTTLTALMPIVQMLVQHLSGLAVQLMPLVGQVIGALSGALSTLAPVIGGVIAQLAPLIASLVTQLSPIITNLVTAILPPLITIFNNIIAAVVPLIMVIMAMLIPAIQALLPVVVTVFNFVAELIKNVMQAVQGVIQVVTGIITGNWSQVWEGIGNIFGAVWNNIVTIVTGVIAIVGAVIAMGMSNASRIVGGALSGIGQFFADTWSNVVNGVSSMIGEVTGFFGGLIGKITGAIGNVGTALYNTGVNIIQGLINGIGSMMGAIGRAVISIVPEAIRGPFEQLLGIHSPSRVFMGYGMNIGQGLINGLDGMHGKIESAVTGLVSVPAIPAFGAGSYTAALEAQTASSPYPSRMALMINGREFEGYLVDTASGVVQSADSQSQYKRKGRLG
jgi:phage-related protein